MNKIISYVLAFFMISIVINRYCILNSNGVIEVEKDIPKEIVLYCESILKKDLSNKLIDDDNYTFWEKVNVFKKISKKMVIYRNDYNIYCKFEMLYGSEIIIQQLIVFECINETWTPISAPLQNN